VFLRLLLRVLPRPCFWLTGGQGGAEDRGQRTEREGKGSAKQNSGVFDFMLCRAVPVFAVVTACGTDC
jgi:hypothetical protein